MWPKYYSFFKPSRLLHICSPSLRLEKRKEKKPAASPLNSAADSESFWTENEKIKEEKKKEKGRSGSPLCLEGRFSTNHWSRIEQCLFCNIKKSWNQCCCFFFRGLLPPPKPEDSANSRLLHHSKCSFETDSSPSFSGWPSTDWVMRSSVVWCTVCSFIVEWEDEFVLV